MDSRQIVIDQNTVHLRIEDTFVKKMIKNETYV